MAAYDAVNFSPAAPVARIDLRDGASGKVCANVAMLLDSGADVTLLPRDCINRLQMPIDPSQVYDLMGFDGARSSAVAVHLDLIFLGTTFRGRFLVIDQSDGVLGRDILNHLHIALNGPMLLWDVIK